MHRSGGEQRAPSCLPRSPAAPSVSLTWAGEALERLKVTQGPRPFQCVSRTAHGTHDPRAQRSSVSCCRRAPLNADGRKPGPSSAVAAGPGCGAASGLPGRRGGSPCRFLCSTLAAGACCSAQAAVLGAGRTAAGLTAAPGGSAGLSWRCGAHGLMTR